jgi:hypothetical protein
MLRGDTRRAAVGRSSLALQLRPRRHHHRPLRRLREPDRVPERIAQPAVGPVEALDRLLGELNSLRTQILVGGGPPQQRGSGFQPMGGPGLEPGTSCL